MGESRDRTDGPRDPTSHDPTYGRVCGHCGQLAAPGSSIGALLPDSSVIDPDGLGRDGRRYVTACGAGHLQLLIDQARRDWVAEQLWFGQLCRASTVPVTRDLPISHLGERARLTPDHLRRAVEWNTRSERPRVTLPGGQVLPTGPAPPGQTT